MFEIRNPDIYADVTYDALVVPHDLSCSCRTTCFIPPLIIPPIVWPPEASRTSATYIQNIMLSPCSQLYDINIGTSYMYIEDGMYHHTMRGVIPNTTKWITSENMCE